jgi:hypothetical protein
MKITLFQTKLAFYESLDSVRLKKGQIARTKVRLFCSSYTGEVQNNTISKNNLLIPSSLPHLHQNCMQQNNLICFVWIACSTAQSESCLNLLAKSSCGRMPRFLTLLLWKYVVNKNYIADRIERYERDAMCRKEEKLNSCSSELCALELLFHIWSLIRSQDSQGMRIVCHNQNPVYFAFT